MSGVMLMEDLRDPAHFSAAETAIVVNPAALPLDLYLDEVISLLTKTPTPNEIVVHAALRLRWAERDGTYASLLEARLATRHRKRRG